MKFAVHQSESLEFVRSLPDASVDCVVTDPPYGLGKEPDAVAMLRDWMTTGHHDHKGGGGFMGKKWDAFDTDSGGASRFFYCAKASRSEREAGLREAGLREVGLGVGALSDGGRLGTTGRNHHPTVKPIALMRWLVRLVTPPGGTVHDFFTGSGTTGCAAMLEGFDFVGCDREADYVEIARARIEFWRKASPSHIQAEFGEFTGVGK